MYLFIVGLLGIMFNNTIIALYWNHSVVSLIFSRASYLKNCFKLRTDYHMLLLNLILTELMICLYGIPVDFLATLQGGWIMGKELCVATGFILTVLGRKIIFSK